MSAQFANCDHPVCKLGWFAKWERYICPSLQTERRAWPLEGVASVPRRPQQACLLSDGRRLSPVKARKTKQVLAARAALARVRLCEEDARAADAVLAGEVGLHLTPGLLAARSIRTRPRWMTPDEGEDDGIMVLGVDEELEAPTNASHYPEYKW